MYCGIGTVKPLPTPPCPFALYKYTYLYVLQHTHMNIVIHDTITVHDYIDIVIYIWHIVKHGRQEGLAQSGRPRWPPWFDIDIVV